MVLWYVKTFCEKVWEKCRFADESEDTVKHGPWLFKELRMCVTYKGCRRHHLHRLWGVTWFI